MKEFTRDLIDNLTNDYDYIFPSSAIMGLDMRHLDQLLDLLHKDKSILIYPIR